MAGKLGWLTLVLALALPVCATVTPGSIAGVVKSATGVPQMGAAVQVFNSATSALTVFTDANGSFSVSEISPGNYNVKVTAPSFLPSLRENVAVKAGASLIVNITLNTLFEAIQLVPPRRRTAEEQDDWKWTLRSAANRPILRVLEEGPLVVVSKSDNDNDRALKARVAFMAGSEAEGFGRGSDMSTAFTLERSMFSSGTVSLKGDVGYSGGPAATVLRAGYTHEMPGGSRPELNLTMRHFANPDMLGHNSALQALALSLSDNISIADEVDFNFGTEYQTIQFMGRVSAMRPFGSADLHLDPDTVLEYRYATSVPNMRREKGFDSAPADLSESGPRVSLSDDQLALERTRHQEISVSRREGKNNFQLAFYSERMANSALTGIGDVTSESGVFLPDVLSGTFTYNGGQLNTNGIRAVAQRKLASDITATLNYSYGGVLTTGGGDLNWDAIGSSLRVARRHSLAGKVSGTLPASHTRWIASYKWTSGDAVTPVDMFNTSAGQSDPYLNLFIRQPIPSMGFLPARMEALVDIRNLLAQGYLPVLGRDGHTMYLVQSARAIRGGVSFTF
jgi:Carboxypeptidase regulatory-like domain